MEWVAGVGGQGHGAALLEQQRRVATHPPVRPKHRRDAEDRRLEHRVQAGAVKSAAHKRNVAQGVEVGEDPDAVDHDHRTRFRVLELRQPDRTGQLEVSQAVGDRGEVIGIGLVRRQQQAGGRKLMQQIREGRQEHCFIRRPSRARDDRERVGGRRGKPRERLARRVQARRALGDAVIARVARDRDRLGTGAEQLQALAIFLADRADAIERAIRRRRPVPRRPAQPRAVGRDGGRDQAQLHAAARRGERELRPHVEFAEHEGGGLQRVEHRRHFGRPVERQIVCDVDRQVLGEPLGRRRKEREGELPVGMLGAQGLEDRLCLQALADRWRVHPDQGPFRIALGRPPTAKTGGQPAPPIQPSRHLLIEPCYQRRRAGHDVHAQPVQ